MDLRPDEYTHSRSTAFYARVFLGLALATCAEVLTVLFVPYHWLRVAVLLSMAMVQSMLLVMNIMHLRWDKLIFAFLFFSGFVTAILLVTALVALYYL